MLNKLRKLVSTQIIIWIDDRGHCVTVNGRVYRGKTLRAALKEAVKHERMRVDSQDV